MEHPETSKAPARINNNMPFFTFLPPLKKPEDKRSFYS
jgi:hypothetical protein